MSKQTNRTSAPPADAAAPKRASGILFHPTSLPGRYGIGTFNASAYAFVDFLAAAGQSIWQVLPLGPTSYGDSPYQSLSTYAGNPYLISVEALVDDGLMSSEVLHNVPEFPEDKVDYEALYNWKMPLLRKAAEHHLKTKSAEFAKFCKEEASWLDDYALFVAIKSETNHAAWNTWEMPLRRREPEALAEARKRLSDAVQTEKILQWWFFRQFRYLKAYANQKGVRLFGDIPIFVAQDSADAWCHPDIFHFDKDLQPKVVAGVPPDYFAVTGQLWGNPLYNWTALKKSGYQWWIDRVRHSFRLFDLLRIDHFRGFAAYWEVKAGAETAVDGRWVPGPGKALFEAIEAALGKLDIIAEDLGDITPDVIALRDGLKLPGMKIVQFGFGSDAGNPFLVHNYTENFVVYTGTHDNDTVRGWYEKSANPNEKEMFTEYFGQTSEPASQVMMRAAMQSVAKIAITPLQDVLDAGGEARMNFPGQAGGNWQWRLKPNELGETHKERLLSWTRLYGRLPVSAAH